MASSTPTGFRYPQASDTPTVELYIQHLAEDVEAFTSKVGHTHDTLYSGINHNHATLYSPINHTHANLPNLPIVVSKDSVHFSGRSGIAHHGLGRVPQYAMAILDVTNASAGSTQYSSLKIVSSSFTITTIGLSIVPLDFNNTPDVTFTVHVWVAG